MRYQYTAAWRVVGGLNLPAGMPMVILTESPSCTAILTIDPSEQLKITETALAFGTILLQQRLAGKTAEDWASVLAAESAQAGARRESKTKKSPVLVVSMSGAADPPDDEKLGTEAGVRFAMDAIDKAAIRLKHRRDVESARVAVCLAGPQGASFQFLEDSVCLIDDNGDPIFSVTFQAFAEVAISGPVTDEMVLQIGESILRSAEIDELESVRRLFVQMVDTEVDKLRRFLAGWTALEILIGKLFNKFETDFFTPAVQAAHPSLRERFLDRVRDVMVDKYRLTEKFLVVTAVLFAESDAATVDEYEKAFKRVKKLRDSITHGREFDEKELPIADLKGILRSYVAAALKVGYW